MIKNFTRLLPTLYSKRPLFTRPHHLRLFSAQTPITNPYKVLQLDPDCTPKDIKNAFAAMARLYHPDINPAFTSKFQEILAAYELLQNPTQKKLIDAELQKETEKKNFGLDPLTKWLYKSYNIPQTPNDGTQVPPHILKVKKKPRNTETQAESEHNQIRFYDKALLLVFFIGLYYYFQNLKSIPRARPFNEAEDDAFAAQIDARRKSKVKKFFLRQK